MVDEIDAFGVANAEGVSGQIAALHAAALKRLSEQASPRESDEAKAERDQQSNRVSEPEAVSRERDAASGGSEGLSEAERKMVDQLKSRDREVRDHEQAHALVGGQYAGSPSYEYQTGPDGNRYAVGGEVPIDASPAPGDPEATVQKMIVVERAAMAPAEPSAQDRKVAAQAQATRLQAQAELLAERSGERSGEGGKDEQKIAGAGYEAAGKASGDAAAEIRNIVIGA